MRKILLALCATAGLAAFAPAEAGTGKAAEEDALRDALAKAQNGDMRGAIGILKPAISDPDFSLLTSAQRHLAYRILGAAEIYNGTYEEAMSPLKHATAMTLADGVDWYLRFVAAFRTNNDGDTLDSLTELARKWPKKLLGLSDYAILQIVGKAAKEPGPGQRALLEALGEAKWQPADPFISADTLHLALARLDMAEGKTADALAAAQSLDGPMSLVEILVDKRFDAMVSANPAQFDTTSAVASMLAEAKAKAAHAPDKLEGVDKVARLLFETGRAAEALPMLEKAVARATSADGKPSPYSDAEEELIWTMNLQSQVLAALGRDDEAVAVLVYASRHSENGQMNVSQTINLADLYDSLGRPKDALGAVAAFDSAPISSYGAMALADARACAYVQLKDSADLDKTLAYMKSHTSDGMQPLLNTLLCTNDLDSAAGLVIAELKAPERRMSMLLLLQDYLQPSHRSSIGTSNRDRLLSVRARRDVQEEIAKVGRIESFAILPPDY